LRQTFSQNCSISRLLLFLFSFNSFAFYDAYYSLSASFTTANAVVASLTPINQQPQKTDLQPHQKKNLSQNSFIFHLFLFFLLFFFFNPSASSDTYVRIKGKLHDVLVIFNSRKEDTSAFTKCKCRVASSSAPSHHTCTHCC
jgi:hypothetical protein